jgi:hypothetical protein
MRALPFMDQEAFPYVAIEISGGVDHTTGGFDGNGSFAADLAFFGGAEAELAYLRNHLQRLSETGTIEKYGLRHNQLVGYQLRIIAKAEFIEEIQKLEFVMKLRWPSFRITNRSVIHVSELAMMTSDLDQVSSLY